MLEFVKGTLDDSKEELRNYREQWQSNVTLWRKNHRLTRSQPYRPVRIQKMIDEEEWLLSSFKLSKCRPVTVEGTNIVIDYGLYQSIIKKLKKFNVDTIIENNHITVAYENPTELTSGCCHLYNLSKSFPNTRHLPQVNVNKN